MTESFPGTLDILDKHGKKVDVFPSDSSTFNQHFTIHQIAQTARNPRPNQQYVLVTIKTKVTLSYEFLFADLSDCWFGRGFRAVWAI